MQWVGHIESYFPLSSHYYNIIILERWVIPCALDGSTVCLIYPSLVYPIFWHLDNTRQYYHFSVYDYYFTNYLSFDYDCNSCVLLSQAPFLGDMPSTSWVETFRSTKGFGSVSLSIHMGYIWSQHAYSYEKAHAGVTSLFCRSLGPHIKALIEHAVWNCNGHMDPVTYLGAQTLPMLCGLPQYIGWASQVSPHSG